LSIAVNLGRVVIMRQVADWLGKHATLPIDTVTVRENGSVTIRPSGYGTAEIHNLYAIAEAAGAEVHVNSREYSLGWQLTAAWNIGQIPVESEVVLSRMADEVRPVEPVESDSPEAPAAERAPELAAAHA
jgi:hypothetical protein